MWAWIIPLLLQLLVTFLEYLFKKWLHVGTLTAYKEAYLQKIKWRFWLGPKRMDLASQLFDKAAQRFEIKRALLTWPISDVSAKTLAQELTDGLSV